MQHAGGIGAGARPAGQRAPGRLLRVLAGETVWPPPIWLMRQAGRYLPEYRATRAQAGSFLDLCFNPDLACEVTLQPIRRFGFDASILFSDILVIPHALGRRVRFEEGRGPVLEPLTVEEIPALAASVSNEEALARLARVMEAVGLIRAGLPAETDLIGFCGAPWTVATYMIAGHGTSDQAPTRVFAHRHPEAFALLLERIADVSADYLVAQVRAGADALQIFDSWAGVLDAEQFGRWCVAPVARLVARVRAALPHVPIIGFPKGTQYLAGYRQATGVTALGLDWTVPLDLAARLQREGPVQGNLDPQRLIAGGAALEYGVAAILDGLGRGPLVFNLGHGITPDAPVAHVEQLLRLVRGAAPPA